MVNEDMVSNCHLNKY